MTPVFIVSPPRSRGSVLARMLNATGTATIGGEADDFMAHLRKLLGSRTRHVERHAGDEWPRCWIPPEDGGEWDRAILDLLPAWVRPQEGQRHFGVRLQWLGREGQRESFDWWSWLLETWPESRILFVARDQGEVEMSMLMTARLWVPKWGKCSGCVGGRVHQMLDSMAQFHWLNPTRTAWIDSAALAGDHAALSAALAPHGIELPEATWQAVLAEVLGSGRQMVPEDASDPFHPLATAETLAALPGPETPQVADPFASDATELDLEHLPGPRMQGPLNFEDQPRGLRLTVPKRYRAIEPGKLAVYTLRWGEKDWMTPCVDSLRDWTTRHGYPLHVWGQPAKDYPSPKFACLDMIRDFLSGEADQMLYLDADVLIHPLAPGWEDKPGFRIAEDTCTNRSFWTRKDRWMRRHYRALSTAGHVYRNAGVWSCDREAARRFLREAESAEALLEGCMEQHQFNVFWQRAAQVGMRLEMLPQEWNMMVHNRPDSPAWFFHLAGGEFHKPRYLETVYAKGFCPRPPRPFQVREPFGDRAIVIPWISRPAAWEELRFALRSWEKHFADKDCPIYIVGDEPPRWLVPGHRVVFLPMEGYVRSWEDGMFQARETGYQIARRVLWTNDDIYLLRPQDWSDFEVALTEGTLHQRVAQDLESRNSWRRMLGGGTATLIHHGFKRVFRFATHTPVLYELEKAREILRTYPVAYKGTFANYYHNHHRTPHRPCGRDKVKTLPAPPEARFLNHGGAMPSREIVRGVLEMFPDPAPWEDPAQPPADPNLPPAARLCVATCGENLDWLRLVDLPACVYDATGESTEHIAVPNRGREAGQYLRHILTHYGRFADHEIFLQGHPFDHCPAMLDELAAAPWQGRRVHPLGPILTRQHQGNTPRAIAFAKSIGIDYHQDVPWPHGAQFAASREALMSRSKKWWAQLLAKVEADHYAPWALERLWLLILDPEIASPILA